MQRELFINMLRISCYIYIVL